MNGAKKKPETGNELETELICHHLTGGLFLFSYDTKHYMRYKS